MALLCHSLATTSRGVIPVERALELVVANPERQSVRRVMTPVLHAIRNGQTVAAAMRTQRRHLPEEFIELVAAGEIGGRLEVALQYLAEEYDRRLVFQRMVVNSMTYPLCIWATASIIIPFFRGLVLSPLSTEKYVLMFLGQLAASWVPLLLVLILLGQLGVLDKLGYACASRLWPASTVLHNLAVVRFLRTLAMLLESGLSLPRSIERAAAVTANPRLRKALVNAVPSVQRGEDLTTALASSGVLPELAVEMIHTGEFSGSLEVLLHKAAQYIEDATTYRTGLFQTVFFAYLLPAMLATYMAMGLMLQGVMLIRSLISKYGL